MGWKPNKNAPICPQICEQMCVRIAKGSLEPHSRLMSVRELAVALGVNPNTVQRAFEQLEQEGVLYSVPGTGWYVSEDTHTAKSAVQKLMDEYTNTYFAAMENLGLDKAAVNEYLKEREA